MIVVMVGRIFVDMRVPVIVIMGKTMVMAVVMVILVMYLLLPGFQNGRFISRKSASATVAHGIQFGMNLHKGTKKTGAIART
jgi:hypothetical protein